jgi:hypothetical protein
MDIALSSPFGRPLHQLALELVFVGAAAVTLRHAVGRWRAGERQALFQWLTAFAYGIGMELIAFNYVDNYQHAQFTVQLYRQKLPFYVICVYPVFHYSGLKLIERWRLGPVAEALLVGFAVCMVDVPFDIAGVCANWWVWTDSDPNTAARWLGVPITSYYWYLTFGAVYAGLMRALRRRLQRRSLGAQVALAPLAAFAVIALGTVAFLPFHGLHALGVPPDFVVAAHLAACAVLAVYCRPAAPAPAARSVVAVPLALAAFHLVVLAMLAARGQATHGAVRLVSAGAAALALVFLSRRARAWPAAARGAR